MNYEADLVSMFVVNDNLCYWCRRQMKYKKVQFKLNELMVESFCVYQDISKEMLIQYKELFDEALYPLFFYPIRKYVKKKYRGYVIVDIPSHTNKVKQRGFNHLKRMLEVINLPQQTLFSKNILIEQKHLSFAKRQENSLNLLELIGKVPNKPILLVDDVCTSGATLLAAIEKIKGHRYPIKALTFSYHENLGRKKDKWYYFNEI
jgi:Predicted amidophosphoribosyltransferases